MTIGVLMLAAGYSRRYGGDKRLATLPGGQTLLDASISRAQQSGLPLLVALRAEDAPLAEQLETRQVPAVRCKRSALGMGHSLAEAVAAMPEGWSGVLIALGDMPLIQTSTFRLLAAALTPENIVVPWFRGRRGHPVGFGAGHFTDLRRLTGDRGAGGLLQARESLVVRVPVHDEGILLDVDEPGQRDRLVQRA